MMCRGCGNKDAYHVRTVYESGEVYDVCDTCGRLDMSGANIPDVYLARSGETFNNLCDEMGRPYEIGSKRQKKEIMDRLGVSEAGDRVNGAPFGTKSWIDGTRQWRRKQFDKERPMLRNLYQRYLENVRKK